MRLPFHHVYTFGVSPPLSGVFRVPGPGCPALGIEVFTPLGVFSRDRATQSAQSWGLGPPSFMYG